MSDTKKEIIRTIKFVLFSASAGIVSLSLAKVLILQKNEGGNNE